MERLRGMQYALVLVILIGLSSTAWAHTDVTPQEAKDLIDTNNNLMVVDVREVSEYCSLSGHIPGAFNYPWNSGVLEDRYGELPLDAEILVVCGSGSRSNQASTFLDTQGYLNIHDMTGGMSDWEWETIGCHDTDNDGLNDDLDNCPDIPNGPNLGSCINILTGIVGSTCMNDGECGTGETCSNDQENRDNDGAGDACDIGTFCRGLADYDRDVDAADVTVFLSHFGRSQYNNPCPPDGPTPVAKTGQTTSYATGDDGDSQRGVALVTPRFTDNGNGTVTDNQTGLIWLKNADCWGAMMWFQALSHCNGLADGQCGLTDGSQAGYWRLANKREYFSLIHDGYVNFSLPNTAGTGQWSEGDPFNSVHPDWYWSSTTYVYNPSWAWDVWIRYGYNNTNSKLDLRHVWCVRGGH